MTKDFYCDKEKAGGQIVFCINKINHYRGDTAKHSYTCVIPNFHGDTQHSYVNRKTFLGCLISAAYIFFRSNNGQK